MWLMLHQVHFEYIALFSLISWYVLQELTCFVPSSVAPSSSCKSNGKHQLHELQSSAAASNFPRHVVSQVHNLSLLGDSRALGLAFEDVRRQFIGTVQNAGYRTGPALRRSLARCVCVCVCAYDDQTEVTWHKYERRLGVSGLALGLSLTKTGGGFAEVTRVVPGGEAERLEVVVGSYVVGVNDVKTTSFEEIVELVRTLPRPILFRFVLRPSIIRSTSNASAKLAAAVAPRSAPTISSVPEPISVAVEITFDENELGCSLQVREHGCVVLQVDKGKGCIFRSQVHQCLTSSLTLLTLMASPMSLRVHYAGGPAHKRGVLVGSRIVEVNGRRFLKPEEVIREIQTSQRPMRVKFHRVEGLMRGWNRR